MAGISQTPSHSFPQIIHQTWKNCDLPSVFQYWSASWKLFNPNYHYRLWTDEDNLHFIQSKYPEFLSDYLTYNHHIKRVDAVRYFYLYEYGGIYCDLDFECLKSFDTLLTQHEQFDVILGYMGLDRNFEHCIPNAIMISKPKSAFWLYVISEMKKRVNCKYPEYDTGPELLKYCVDTYQHVKDITILHQDIFYGINWADDDDQKLRHRVVYQDLLLDGRQKQLIFPSAYAVTYWTHSW